MTSRCGKWATWRAERNRGEVDGNYRMDCGKETMVGAKKEKKKVGMQCVIIRRTERQSARTCWSEGKVFMSVDPGSHRWPAGGARLRGIGAPPLPPQDVSKEGPRHVCLGRCLLLITTLALFPFLPLPQYHTISVFFYLISNLATMLFLLRERGNKVAMRRTVFLFCLCWQTRERFIENRGIPQMFECENLDDFKLKPRSQFVTYVIHVHSPWC